MPFAAFRHHTSRDGFEVVFIAGRRFEGHTRRSSRRAPYARPLRDRPRRRAGARVAPRSATGPERSCSRATARATGASTATPAPELDGCLDVDLEASAVTNAFPVARGATDAPAAWVRASTSRWMRLEQTYERIGERTYDYNCPRFDFRAEIVYGEDGFVLEYPGIATRVPVTSRSHNVHDSGASRP